MDTDLVVRARGGDQAAFELLASGVHPRLQQLAFRILRDRELARDAAQVATLSIWRNLPQQRDPARFEEWSYRLCVNACHRESRRRKRSIPEIGSDTYREPRTGTFRLETDEGAWEGVMSGFWDRHETRASGWLRGEGAYTGLSLYLESVIDHAGGPAEMVGAIVPGDPPSDPPTFD
jgi:DNA-directed RNA polymerase specialized sigma24 family protein